MNVTKSYQRGDLVVPVLDGLSLNVPEGQFLALMGPSGSGKSTLLNLIAGIDHPTSGTIQVAGTPVTGLSDSQLARWRADHVGFIFQFYNLMPVLTAFENVALPLHLTGMSKERRNQQVRNVLNLVGLDDRMDHYPNQLSGGQQQRVAIARAIATDPKIIVADEPTGDLDRASAEEIMTLLGRLNSEMGKTIIMVTHDPMAADRATVQRHLDKGRLE
ncbi:MAG: ABC transporter ATP-binding protein [Acidobacteria bacterium]|nr:ABC transporter ATP-binding protein [Acidobacteriota bacterium]MCB9396641.1 ABC transporter ATP-binding protein [Acidobacteriota bacterium]